MLGRGLNATAYGFMVVFSIPFLGRALKWGWSLLLTAVWALVSAPGVLLSVAGITWEKHLRVRVVVVRDERGRPVASETELEQPLEEAREIFLSQARVRIEYGQPTVAVTSEPADARILEPGCSTVGSLFEDFGVRGGLYERLAAKEDFAGNARRLIGYGAPVVVFVVRGYTTRHLGCSLGPFADYVTVAGTKPICVAHELGHACGLPHTRHDDNLMFSRCGRRRLNRWQVAVIRSARQVTTF